MQTNSYKIYFQQSLALLLCATLFSGCLVFATKKKNVGVKTFKVDKETEYINVMGKEMPEIPKFPSLSPKSGKARGYVKDVNGNPLKGAHIGVRSSLGGSYYSGASGGRTETVIMNFLFRKA